MSFRLLRISAVLAALCGAATAQGVPNQRAASVPYTWKSVQMVGGGFVTASSSTRPPRACATPAPISAALTAGTISPIAGTAARLGAVRKPQLDGRREHRRRRVDPNRVYLACGTYTNPTTPDGAILRSSDRGKTFQHTNVPFKFGGNENGRGHGERLAVDPNDGTILYLGTRHDGLWKSVDRAVTWNKVANFPDVTEAPPAAGSQQGQGSGIVFVVFDPRSGAKGKASSTIYAGVSLPGRDNLFRSKDAGKSWQPVPGAPVQYRPRAPRWLPMASSTSLMSPARTHTGRPMVASGSSTPPAARGRISRRTGPTLRTTEHSDMAVFRWTRIIRDPDRQHILPSGQRRDFPQPRRRQRPGMVYSPRAALYDFSLAPYVAKTPIHWLFDVEIDPANSDHAIFTTGYGGYETFNLTAMDSGKPTKCECDERASKRRWRWELFSPSKGVHLLTAIGDYGGFVHRDLDKPAPEGSSAPPRFGNTTGVAGAENSPDTIVRVGRAAGNSGGGNIGYSMDGAARGSPLRRAAQCQHGEHRGFHRRRNLVWTPERGAVYFTRDIGGRGPSRGHPREHAA